MHSNIQSKLYPLRDSESSDLLLFRFDIRPLCADTAAFLLFRLTSVSHSLNKEKSKIKKRKCTIYIHGIILKLSDVCCSDCAGCNIGFFIWFDGGSAVLANACCNGNNYLEDTKASFVHLIWDSSHISLEPTDWTGTLSTCMFVRNERQEWYTQLRLWIDSKHYLINFVHN